MTGEQLRNAGLVHVKVTDSVAHVPFTKSLRLADAAAAINLIWTCTLIHTTDAFDACALGLRP